MSKFVAVGHNGLRVTSADGVTWDKPQVGKEGETYRAVAYGNGAFAAVGGFGWGDQLMAVSPDDGATWRVSVKTKQTNYRSVVFGNGKFLAMAGDPAQVGDARPVVATSTDGATWTDAKRISGKWLIRRIVYGNGTFAGVGDRGRRSVSPDGLEWKDAPDMKPVDTLADIAFGNGVFVGVGMHGLRTSSRDGLKWSPGQIGKEGEHLNSVVFTGGKFVAVGLGATWTSPDGEKWERTPNTNAPLSCVVGGGAFIGTAWRGRILRSTDAVAWTEVAKCPHHIECVVFGGK
ncbi:MAG: WD40/YVTN/BNR-like repeat-containing protein [Phycisphaerae bacterium]|nr:hypothetical protein [Tepidisphaeraceae bacterium]